MFRLSYTSNGLENLSLERAIEEVAKAGYEGIEIVPRHSRLHPFEVTKEDLNKLKELFARFQVEPVALLLGNPYALSDIPFEPTLFSPDEEGRKKCINFINATLEVANYLSIPLVTFTTGFMGRDFTHDCVPAEEARQMLIDGIRTCLKNAGDVVIAIEPEPIGMFIETTVEAIEIIREIDSPQLKLTLDICHTQCGEPDLLQRTAEALPYTKLIHIADIKGRIHYHEIPGEGEFDFPSLFQLFRKANYEDYLSVELYWHCDVWEKALYQSRKYLLEQMKASEENI